MSAWQNIAGNWKRGALWENVAGVWKQVTDWQNVGGTWKHLTVGGGALTAVASPTYVSGAIYKNTSRPAGTNATTVAVTGGYAPYTFAWPPSGSMTAAQPTAATTIFQGYVGPGDTLEATFVCTVTDSNGAITTASVDASVSNFYSDTGLS